MSYLRVIPRDLFNEADLLKMLGKLVIHTMNNPTCVPWSYEHDDAEHEFRIVQNPEDGSIYCSNLRFFIDGEGVDLFRSLNCQEPWSLKAFFRGEEYEVFDGNGNVTATFGYTYG